MSKRSSRPVIPDPVITCLRVNSGRDERVERVAVPACLPGGTVAGRGCCEARGARGGWRRAD